MRPLKMFGVWETLQQMRFLIEMEVLALRCHLWVVIISWHWMRSEPPLSRVITRRHHSTVFDLATSCSLCSFVCSVSPCQPCVFCSSVLLCDSCSPEPNWFVHYSVQFFDLPLPAPSVFVSICGWHFGFLDSSFFCLQLYFKTACSLFCALPASWVSCIWVLTVFCHK